MSMCPTFYGLIMEIWKDIEKYEGHYQASDLGRIKSLQRIVPHGKKGTQVVGEKILRPSIKKGYKCVILCKEDVKKFHQVHILIATAFVENPDNKPFVNHKDGEKLNCVARNLEWNTSLENRHHASAMGLLGKKLTITEVLKIRELASTMKCTELAIIFKVNKSTIKGIKYRKIWVHV